MSFADLPPDQITVERVLGVISENSRARSIIWTAGRVLKEDGSLQRIAAGAEARRRLIFRRVRTHLKELERAGLLEPAGNQFNFGMGNEAGYRYIG